MQFTIRLDVTTKITISRGTLTKVHANDFRQAWDVTHVEPPEKYLIRVHIHQETTVCTVYDEQDNVVFRKILYNEVFRGLTSEKHQKTNKIH